MADEAAALFYRFRTQQRNAGRDALRSERLHRAERGNKSIFYFN